MGLGFRFERKGNKIGLASSLALDLKGMGIRLVGGGEEGKKAAPTWGTQRCEKRSRGRLRQDSPTLELGCNFSVSWRMVDEIPV